MLVTDFGARDGRLSPDNLWLAYVSNESGRDEVFIARFPDLTSKIQVSSGGAAFPLWHGDGKELFYVAEGGMIAAVEVNVSGDSIHLGNPETLFQVSFPRGTTPQRKYAVSSDGEKFLVIQTTDPGESRSITILSDWKSRLAPQ